MEATPLRVLYGVLGEGRERVARDPTGYLAIEQGIYRQHGLELSWDLTSRARMSAIRRWRMARPTCPLSLDGRRCSTSSVPG